MLVQTILDNLFDPIGTTPMHTYETVFRYWDSTTIEFKDIRYKYKTWTAPNVTTNMKVNGNDLFNYIWG